MKKDKIIYWVATGILTALFTFSSMMYFFNYPYAKSAFISLGFPTWIIYPLAVLKLLGVLAILSKKSTFLKELAYAGLLYDVLLAFTAHLSIGDGQQLGSIIGIVSISISWIYDRKVFGNHIQSLTQTKKL